MEFTPIVGVRQLMVRDPVAVPPDQPLGDVVRLMNERGVGAALVRDGPEVVGIFTERDFLRNGSLAPGEWLRDPVSAWMTRDPWTIQPEATWEQALSLMETLHVRHIPVVEDGHLIGLVSARDLIEQYNVYLNRMVEERTQELREANLRLQHRDAELRMHMTVAGRIQERLLPADPPETPEIRFATHYQPLDPLGGDYYDFARPDDRHVGFLLSDASGHSIPAAMVAIMARTAFAMAARASSQPGPVLAAMNRQLHGLTGEHFVTAFYGVFDRHERRLRYANAGHPLPLYLDAKARACKPLEARGLMLGVMPDSTYDEHELSVAPGDRVLLYTDGVVDCQDDEGKAMGGEKLEAFLLANREQSARSLVMLLADALSERRHGCRAQDDMTLVALEVKA